MALVLSEEQQMLMDSAAEFLSETAAVPAFRALRDAEEAYDSSLWQSMTEFGWPAILAPAALGGLGFGIGGLGIVAFEVGKNLTVSPLFASAGESMSALLACDASQQRDQTIEGIAAGELKVALCFTETHRFSPTNIQATATKTAAGYRLNGTKAYVAEGNYADKLLVVANEENERTLFVVDADTAGLSRTRLELMDRRDYATVTLEDVRVGAQARLVWASTEGRDPITRMTDVGALINACELYGCAIEAFARTKTYLCDREQFGKKIGAFQALQHRMAYAYTQLELLKTVVLDALSAHEEDRKDASLAISHAKTLAGETASLITQEAIQMHGGIGITDELDIGLFYKRARVLQTAYGDKYFHKDRFALLSGF